MTTKQNICLLGATGSIGESALAVMKMQPERFNIMALSAHCQKEKLLSLCRCFKPRYAVVTREEDALWLRQRLGNSSTVEVYAGEHALIEIASLPEVDTVISAIVGIAGAVPTFAAAKAGKKILLANKETIVMGGELFLQAVKEGGATVLPVDSEHNAIFQVLPHDKRSIKKIILTASGGPFLRRPLDTLHAVTPQEALAHPNWSMGAKISIDSATMMNKALEVIEARWLFDLTANQIEVLIHPQSIVHSLVCLLDESLLAQLGSIDMRLSLSYCLAYPQRMLSGVTALALEECAPLTFMKVDEQRFPALKLAYAALEQGHDAACILNAANETAVSLFLEKRIAFTGITVLVEKALQEVNTERAYSLQDLLHKDQQVRSQVAAWARAYSV